MSLPATKKMPGANRTRRGRTTHATRGALVELTATHKDTNRKYDVQRPPHPGDTRCALDGNAGQCGRRTTVDEAPLFALTRKAHPNEKRPKDARELRAVP